jgi:hypothetical protein
MSYKVDDPFELVGDVKMLVEMVYQKKGSQNPAKLIGYVVKLKNGDPILVVDVTGVQTVADHWQIVRLDPAQTAYVRQKNVGDTDNWGPYDIKVLAKSQTW